MDRALVSRRAALRRLTVVFLAPVLALSLYIPIASAATSGTLTITANTRLTADHLGTIVVGADNVTLDCAGHLLSGPGDPDFQAGVVVQFRTGVTVKNCRSTGLTTGFEVADSTAVTLVSNEAFANGADGFQVTGASGNTFTANIARENGIQGFAADSGSNGNIFKANQAEANENGFVAAGGASGNAFIDNLAKANHGAGFILVEGASGNTFTDNLAEANDGTGFTAYASNTNTFKANQAVANGNGFVAAGGASGNTFTDNLAKANSHVGFLATGTDGNTFSGNSAIGNRDGFGIVDASGNLLEGNLASRNQRVGFGVVSGSNNNTLRTNSGCKNGFFDAFDDGTGSGNVWESNSFCSTSGI